MIRSKVGKVRGINQTTMHVERVRFTRLSVEVDLSKPLLSKFHLHGKILRIEYEGLKFISFNCGKVGHKDESCPSKDANNTQA